MIKKYNITVNGISYDVEVEELGVGAPKYIRPSTDPQPMVQAKAQPLSKSQSASNSGGSINAPMPGTIFEVNVNVGQEVKKGDVLLILEAMKMENEIMAPHDGVVSHISVSKGSSVSSGDLLVKLG